LSNSLLQHFECAASTAGLSPQLLLRSQYLGTRQHLTSGFFGNSLELPAEPPGCLSNVRYRSLLSLLRLAPAILRFLLNRYHVLLPFTTLASIAFRSFSRLSKHKKNNMNDIEEELNFH
jgi:hypothetical protein